MPAKSVAMRQASAIPLNEAGWGYLAGFLDGEGYITIRRANRGTRKNPAYRLVVGFTSTYLPVLEWIQSAFSAGCINPKTRYGQKHSPAFELTIHQKDIQKVLLAGIYPFSLIKSAQIELGLAFLALGKVRKEVFEKRGKSWPLIRGNPRDFAVREDFKARLTVLNKRGVA